IGAQGGLMIALPVLVGLALGFWLDNRLGTLPWISLVLTLIGATIGPIILYRWVTSSVAQRMESRMERRKQDEETPK
ncbi:MAG: AtpZ/AtpI family protein, partial [Anaerolineae bacterium]